MQFDETKQKSAKSASASKYEIPESKLKNVNVAKLKQTLDALSKRAEKSIIDGEILKLQNSNKADSKESIDRLQNADIVNQEDEHNGHDLKSEKESKFKQATKLVAENSAD